MGIAMMVMVYFHSSLPVDDVFGLHFLKLIGDIGVDIFLIMSGFGIFFSVKKYSSYKAFVAQRCKRILPAFLLISVLWYALQDLLLGDFAVIQFFLDITTLSFWIDGRLRTWYLSSLILLYFLTPLFIKYWRKYKHLDAILIFVFISIAVLIRLTKLNELFGHLLILLFRVPAYLVGLSLGRRIDEKPIIRINIPAAAIVGVVSVLAATIALGLTPFYIPWAFKYLAYLPLAILISIGTSFIPQNKVCSFFGRYSLEIFLLHEKAMWAFSVLCAKVFPVIYKSAWFNVTLNFTAIVCTMFGAYILSELCRKVILRESKT